MSVASPWDASEACYQWWLACALDLNLQADILTVRVDTNHLWSFASRLLQSHERWRDGWCCTPPPPPSIRSRRPSDRLATSRALGIAAR